MSETPGLKGKYIQHLDKWRGIFWSGWQVRGWFYQVSQDFGHVVIDLVNEAGLVPAPCDRVACQLESIFGFWILFWFEFCKKPRLWPLTWKEVIGKPTRVGGLNDFLQAANIQGFRFKSIRFSIVLRGIWFPRGPPCLCNFLTKLQPELYTC